jgi:hypothetical protein
MCGMMILLPSPGPAGYKNERPSFYASAGRFVNPAGSAHADRQSVFNLNAPIDRR